MPNTTNFNWPTPADTDLVKDGAAAIRNLGNGVDTSLVDLKGGTTGQILSKASNADMDFTFITPNVGDITEVQAGVGISVASGTGPIPIITNSSTDLITTAGDILYGTAADTVARLGIGTASQVLAVNSGATAPEWVTPAAGGKVLQVINATHSTQVVNATSTPADTDLTATITPSLATSKVLVIVTQNGVAKNTNNTDVVIDLLRGATIISAFGKAIANNNAGGTLSVGSAAVSYLDSPNTTSATTYKTQFLSSANNANAIVQAASAMSTITLIEIGA